MEAQTLVAEVVHRLGGPGFVDEMGRRISAAAHQRFAWARPADGHLAP